MARPTDWNPLASSDPIPGDPGVVRQAAQNYADVAEAINTARDRLNAITFKGKSHHIDELRGKCEDLVVQIKQASSRCSGAAGALKTYAGALEGAQAKSLPILKEAKEAQGDQRRWKQEEWEQYRRHQRTTNPVERSRAESDYRAAQSKRAAAEGRIAQARERLKAVIKERDEAGDMAAGALRETSRNSPLKDTFWEKVQNVISDVGKWLEEHVKPFLKNLSTIIAVATIVVAVVTVATGGATAPLLLGLMYAGAAVSAASTAVNLAVNAGKVADGKMGWGEFLLRTGVDVVSTAASFAGVGKAASAAKGAVESAVKGASSASKGALSTVVSQVNSGAEAAIIPEDSTDVDQLARFMERGIRKSKRSCIVIVSESPKCGAMYYADRVKKEFPDYDVRVSILGHLQRGGRPTAHDRILASRTGVGAIDAILQGQRNVMIGIRNNEIIYVPLIEAIRSDKPFDKKLITVLDELSI